jgi:hypothetical protein
MSAYVKPVIDLKELTRRTQRYVLNEEMSYAEAIVEICEQMEIEPEDMARIIKGPLKDKLNAEAESRNIIKSQTRKLY